MIRGYVGLLGSGKSYSMVADGLRRFRETHAQVFSDMVGLRFPEAIYLDARAPQQLADLREGLILLDEAQILMSSRFWHKVPPQVLSALAQLRKNGLDVLYTTQNLARVDSVLRELTGEVVTCRRFGRVVVQVAKAVEGKDVLWRRACLLRSEIWRCYDTLEIVGERVGQGVGQSEALARVRAQRLAREHARARKAPEVASRVFAWNGGSLAVTPEARAVALWLLRGGHVRAGDPNWRLAVAREMERRRWLGFFGLKGEQVPVSTTAVHPWCAGYSPAEVQARVSAELEADDILAAAEEDRRQSVAREVSRRRSRG